MRTINPEKVSALLDNLLCGSMAEACRRCNIDPKTPWNWLVQSKLGHPLLQEILFCDVVAPYHVHYSQNVPALQAHQVQQTAFERARDGTLVSVFFQGQRQFERALKPEFEGKSDDDLAIEIGPEFERECYHMVPTMQLLKPSDALVVKMLESWNRRRYGSHSTVDIKLGGVLRLSKDAKPAAAEHVQDAVFEDAPDEAEQGGGHLALADPARTSTEFEERAAAGEFDQAPVTFKNADGQPAALRPDIEALRQQVAELRARGPKQPYAVDAQGRRTLPNLGGSGRGDQPDDASLGLRPSPYAAPYSPPEARQTEPVRPPMPMDERSVGTGAEGIGDGPDPEKIGPHVGFRMTRV